MVGAKPSRELDDRTLQSGGGPSAAASARKLHRHRRAPGQEGLGLHGFGVVIDGDSGSAKQRAVGNFQRKVAVPPPSTDGAVDRPAWETLLAPLRSASEIPAPATFGDAVMEIAQNH